MSGNRKKLIAFNYFGGKFTYVDWLKKYMPNIESLPHFTEVFGGSAVVTLNLPLAKVNTYNDINSEVVNFFKVLREDPDLLVMKLKLTPVSREEYDRCWQVEDVNQLERARRFYVRARQSFFGLGAQRENKGWQMTCKKSEAKGGDIVSKWNNSMEKLYQVAEKLRHVQIEHEDFRTLMPKMDFEGQFFYLDPPYPIECRNSTNDYCHEFTEQDHRDLAEIAHKCKAKIMISGYDCPLMRELYGDWTCIKFPKKSNGIRTKKVQECIWINYSLEEFKEQGLWDIKN